MTPVMTSGTPGYDHQDDMIEVYEPKTKNLF